MDEHTVIARWGAAVDHFNQGDLQPLADMLAEDCEFRASTGPVGTTRAEIIESLRAGLDEGWTGHYPLGLTAAGNFLAGVYRNEYADGTSVIAAGILRFGDDGKIVEMRSIEPPEFVAMVAANEAT